MHKALLSLRQVGKEKNGALCLCWWKVVMIMKVMLGCDNGMSGPETCQPAYGGHKSNSFVLLAAGFEDAFSFKM